MDTRNLYLKIIPPQKIGKEASSFLKKQLYGKSVTLVYDGGPKEDKYSRKLAYVFCEGIHINELMVKSGYGTVAYISKPNTVLFPQMLESKKRSKGIKDWCVEHKRYVDEEKHHYNHNDVA